MELRWPSKSSLTICMLYSSSHCFFSPHGEIQMLFEKFEKAFNISFLFFYVDRGQAEKEFRVEVEAIGHVRHKNLVRLLGYCIEGVHR